MPRLRLAFFVLLSVLLTGCQPAAPTSTAEPKTTAETSENAETSERTADNPVRVGTRNIPTETEAIKAKFAQATQEGIANQHQLAVLQQDSISYQDYELVVNAAVKCLTADGLDVSPLRSVTEEGTDRLTFTFTRGTSTQSDEAIDQHFEKCWDMHAGYVATYWEVLSPAAWEFRERRAAALWEPFASCLREQGTDVPEDASFDDLMNMDNLDAPCYNTIGAADWQG